MPVLIVVSFVFGHFGYKGLATLSQVKKELLIF